MIIVDAFAWLGRAVIEWLRALGHNAFFFMDVVRNIPSSLRRPGPSTPETSGRHACSRPWLPPARNMRLRWRSGRAGRRPSA